MAKLIEIKENKLYKATSRANYYNIEYDASHYANPIICSNCNHDFRTGNMNNDDWDRIMNYDFCPKCGEKFTEFVDRDGNITSKVIENKEKKEYREFIIMANATYEEEKALIEKLWTGHKELIMTGSRKEIQKYLDEYGTNNEDYNIDDEYTIDIDDELFELAGFIDADNNDEENY